MKCAVSGQYYQGISALVGCDRNLMRVEKGHRPLQDCELLILEAEELVDKDN